MARSNRESDLESKFKGELKADLSGLFPGCFILNNDANMIQGIPDLTILYKKHWAILEVKASWNSEHQPNQDWYVDMFDGMSFAAFIFPENKEEVLHDLQKAFRTRR